MKEVWIDNTREIPAVGMEGRWFHTIVFTDGSAIVEEVEPPKEKEPEGV